MKTIRLCCKQLANVPWFLLALVLSFTGFSVPSNARSIAGSDTVSVLLQMAEAILDTNPDSCLTLIETALTTPNPADNKNPVPRARNLYKTLLSYYDSTDHRNSLARGYFDLGHLEEQEGNIDGAIARYRGSASCRDPQYYIFANYYMANIYRRTRQFPLELHCYQDIRDFCTELKDTFNLGKVTNFIGYYYMTHGRYREAMDYFKQTPIILKIKDDYASTLFKGQAWGHMARTCYQWGHYREALIYHERSLEVLHTIFYSSNARINYANQLEGMGLVYTQMGDMDSAEVYLNKSLQMRQDAKDHLGVGMCYDGLGEVNKRLGKYAMAIDYLNKARTLKGVLYKSWKYAGFRANQVTESMSVTFLKLGQVYLDWHKPEPALMAVDSAWILAGKAGCEKGMAEALMEKGNVYLALNNNTEAEQYYQEALGTFRKIDSRSGIVKALQCMGDFYLASGNSREAYDNYLNALSLADSIGLRPVQAETNLKLGQILDEMGDTLKAYPYLLRSLSLSVITQSLENEMETCREFSRFFQKTGQADSALFYYKKYADLQKMIFDQEMAKRLAVLQANRNFKEKEQALQLMSQQKQIKELALKRTRMYGTLVFILMMIIGVLVWVFYSQHEIRMKQKNTELEQRLLRSQLNPHFIFNALQAIHNYCSSATPEEAGNYLSKFARLMRMILENSRKAFIPFANELEFLDHYLKLQKLRFEEKFNYEIKVDPDILPDIMKVPPMLAQPFIENNIEHGILPKKEKGEILISFSLKPGYILFSVEDNGVGMEATAEKKRKEHTSYAIKITLERLQQYKYPVKFRELIQIENLHKNDKTPSGTRVSFPIPII